MAGDGWLGQGLALASRGLLGCGIATVLVGCGWLALSKLPRGNGSDCFALALAGHGWPRRGYAVAVTGHAWLGPRHSRALWTFGRRPCK